VDDDHDQREGWIDMRKWSQRGMPILVIAMIAALLAVMAAPASAETEGKNSQISGVGVWDEFDECGAPPAGYPSYTDFNMLMSGDLVGCWYTDADLENAHPTPSGTYKERGREVFVGSALIDGEWVEGVFDTTYLFTAKWASDGSEIHGRCQHPIVGGSGGLTGVTGRVDFKDDVETGEFNYRGHLKLP
jgi:hypothetical protein